MVALFLGLKLATRFIIVPTVRISGARTSFPQTPVWPAKGKLYLYLFAVFVVAAVSTTTETS